MCKLCLGLGHIQGFGHTRFLLDLHVVHPLQLHLHRMLQNLNLLFAVVIAGHVGAALKHHFIDKDDILIRMLPARFTEKKP